MSARLPLRLARLGLIAVVLSGLSACALFHPHHRVKISVAAKSSAASLAKEDVDYAAAVSAIDARDYLAALDDLQEARAHGGSTARVLNAFGVVYDKLGRFDLSAVYYERARKLDPASAIIAQNMAYSARLQAGADGPAAGSVTAVARAAPPPVDDRPRLVEVSPGVLRLEPHESAAASATGAGR